MVSDTPEGEDEGEHGDFPFVFQGRRFLPAASPTFAVGGDRVLLVLGYGLPTGVDGVRVRVVDALGVPVPGAEVDFVGREKEARGGPGGMALQFSAAALEPGRYSVEVGIPGQGPWSRGAELQVAAVAE